MSFPALKIGITNAAISHSLIRQKQLTHTIVLHPSYFGPQTQPYLESKLYADVEGTCTGKHGYIISVLGISEHGSGNIQPGTGMAEFQVKYSAIVFKPFKGQVVEGLVGNVNKVC